MESSPILVEDSLIIPWAIFNRLTTRRAESEFYGEKKSFTIGTGEQQETFSYCMGLENVRYLLKAKLKLFYPPTDSVLAVNATFSTKDIRVKYIDPLCFVKPTGLKGSRTDVISCDLAPNFHIQFALPKTHLFTAEDYVLVVHMKALFFVRVYDNVKSPLASILWTRDDKDFVITVKTGAGVEEKTEFLVHKFILSVRSHVFERMLQTNMKEAKEGKVEIVDFGLEVVQSAVDFLYDRDQLDEKELDVLIGLLQFADKYEIFDLKFKLENVLRLRIFPDTVAKIVNASITFNANGTAFDGQDMDAEFDIIPV